jgi:hypothetical protein
MEGFTKGRRQEESGGSGVEGREWGKGDSFMKMMMRFR